MRIAIIAAIGILSYLVVVLPGYFFIVPRNADSADDNETSVEQLMEEAGEPLPDDVSIDNPGDAPPPK